MLELKPPRRPRGREQTGRRFCVVVQASDLAEHSTLIVAPMSTAALAASFRPSVEVRRRVTRVLADQIRAVDRSRLGRAVDRLDVAEMADVDAALRRVLELR